MGKRARRSGRTPPTQSLNLRLPLAVLLAVLVGLTLSLLYLTQGPGQERVTSLRLWLGLGNYGKRSERIEEGLKAFLLEKGIDPARVKRSVSWRRKGLSRWKHFREEVPAPPSLLPRRLTKELSESLTLRGGELLEEHLTPDRGALELEVRAGPILTHSLRFNYPPDRRPAQAAIIIDDLGWDLRVAQEVLSLKAEITLAVLPHLPFSSRVAQEAASRNREVLLHLPMEPLAYPQKDPGPGALMSPMSAERLKELVRAGLEA
ncbi:MAG: divergent polysaccharide deacetylase family protein, partial [Nitrospinota bacterium]